MNNKTRNAASLIKFYRPNWPRPVRVIGQGAYGIVFNTNNGRALKIATGNVASEFKALRALQGLYFVPRVNKNNYTYINNMWNFSEAHMNVPNNWGGALLMSKVGNMSLRSYLQKYPQHEKSALKRLKLIVRDLQVKGYSHSNLHTGNVMVSVDSAGRITGMWLIDFGHAQKLRLTNLATGNIASAHNAGHARHVQLAKKYRNIRKNIAKNLALLPKSPRRSPRRAKSVSPRRATPRLRRTST